MSIPSRAKSYEVFGARSDFDSHTEKLHRFLVGSHLTLFTTSRHETIGTHAYLNARTGGKLGLAQGPAVRVRVEYSSIYMAYVGQVPVEEREFNWRSELGTVD